jgi:NADH-quinone oxidoreductase subunit G
MPVDGFAEMVTARLQAAVHEHGPGSVGAVLSPMWTTEEQFMLARVVRRIDPQATLAVGPVPVVGGDETFKGGFVIRAEKCPNRLGAERVLAACGGPRATFDELLNQAGRRIAAIWLNGDYPPDIDWLTVAQAERLASPGLAVVACDMFATRAIQWAQYRWAGASWAERAGTFVNAAGLVQQLLDSPVGPEHARPAGELLWRMLGRVGPVELTDLWREMGQAGVDGYPPRPPGDVRPVPAPFAGNRSAPGIHD